MDTATAAKASDVEEATALIKAQMPETYKAIQAKAASVGKVAFSLVRRSVRGEANCFWACERGYVVGTPFSDCEITRDVAQLMAQFGSTFVCLWGKEAVATAGGAHGTN